LPSGKDGAVQVDLVQALRLIALQLFAQFHQQTAKHVHADESAVFNHLRTPEIILAGLLDDGSVLGRQQ
jgi:hypothetical protein